jgi:hypothetical protein
MADPTVHITNGVPDAGTGVITTLGQTLLDGANVVLGATTDLTTAAGAAGTINSHLRTISRDLAAGIVLQPSANTIGNVGQAGAPWSMTGTVSITGTVNVTGTVAATQSGAWNIGNITGTISLPTGAATAAKQPALGTAGTPSADVITVQGATSMTPLKVDGSGTTQPVSGNVGITGNVNVVQVTSPWVTSVSGNVTCVQSGNWTARCVGNAGGTFDFSSGQNVATPGQAILVGAEFNAVPTTIINGNSSPLQLDSAANLLVNVKTGLVAATQSGTWSTRLQDGAGNAITSDARGTERPLSVQILDSSGNQITSFGGSGGTASNYGSAFPATGTAIGAKDSAGVNMTFLQVNASNALKVDGSAVTQPVSGTFWQATQPISGTVAATQSGTWNITNISGTISLPTGAATSANQPTSAALGSTTSGQTGNLDLGAVTTAAPTYVTGQSNALSLTTAGALRVDGSGITQPVSGTVAVSGTTTISGTITANQGSPPWSMKPDGTVWTLTGTSANVNVSNTVAVSGTFWQATQPVSAASLPLPSGAATSANQPSVAAAASSTSGQTGNLDMGAVTTAAPSYTTGTTNNLSLNTSGGLRVDGSGVTQPVSGTFWQATQPISGTITANQGGTWTVQPGNTANTTPWLVTPKGFQDSGGTDITDTVNHALKVNVVAGGAAGGGTSSTIGAAMPSAATVAMGSVTTAAPSYTTATANALSLNTAGGLRVDGSGVTQPVSGTFWQTTQPISGTITANQGGAPWTMKPDGTAWAMTSTSANVNVTNASIAVTGTFWQATQPVSGTVTANQGGAWNITNISGTISLPTGAATSANQPTNAAAASTTGGQTGTLAFAAVVSGSSVYTNTTSQPLNMDLAGNLKVNTIDPATYNPGSAWNSGTSLNSVVALINSTAITYDTFAGQITQTTTITGGVITFEESFDNGTTYTPVAPQRFIDPSTGQQIPNPYTCVASTNQRFQIIPAGTCQIRARLSTVIAGTGSVTIAWTVCPITAIEMTSSICAGDTPAGNTDAGFPQKIGGVAKTTNPTAVSDGQRVNAIFDKLGKQVVVGAVRDMKGVQTTSITLATENTILTTGGAGVFQDLYGLVLTNSSATPVTVAIKDSTGGTTRFTFAVPAGDTRGFMLPVDSAVKQAVANNNWTATVSSAISTMLVTALYVSNI